jgi:hypothetical protein
MVIASEIAVDIVKHAFITKFNDITADVCISTSNSVFEVYFLVLETCGIMSLNLFHL